MVRINLFLFCCPDSVDAVTFARWLPPPGKSCVSATGAYPYDLSGFVCK